MNKVWTIAQRDFNSYFTSPIAYIVMAMYTLLSGFFFYSILAYFARNENIGIPYNVEMRVLIGQMSMVLLFMSPMLTMKSFAEEKKLGTFELLMTSPVTLTQIVLGKYLASACLFGVLILASLQYPAFLLTFGTPDVGPMVSAYLGFALLGLSFLSVGVFTSSLTENQIIATMLSFAILLLFYVIGWMSENLTGLASQVVSFLSLTGHMENFTKGIIDLTDVLYYFSVIALFLFATIRRMEWGRW